jgi:hypothetical protein
MVYQTLEVWKTHSKKGCAINDIDENEQEYLEKMQGQGVKIFTAALKICCK